MARVLGRERATVEVLEGLRVWTAEKGEGVTVGKLRLKRGFGHTERLTVKQKGELGRKENLGTAREEIAAGNRDNL